MQPAGPGLAAAPHAWTAGVAVLGVILGGLAESTRDLLGDNRNLRTVVERIGGRSGLVDAYLAAVTSLLGMIVAAYAIQAVLRLRAEEASGRAEPVLATAVGRLRWAGSHLAFSVLGPAVALTAAGAAAGLAHGLNTGDVGRELPRVLGAAAVQLPAVWVLAGITVALFGLLPRLAAVGWGVLVGCLLLGLVGAAVRLGQGLLDLSPFTHVPRLPGGSVPATPVLWLAVTATVLGAVGLIGLRRRTIPVG